MGADEDIQAECIVEDSRGRVKRQWAVFTTGTSAQIAFQPKDQDSHSLINGSAHPDSLDHGIMSI